MRVSFTLLLLLFSAYSFGQSAKKQNIQLRQELQEAREEYTTAYTEYFAGLRNYTNGFLRPLMKSTQRTLDEIMRCELIERETFEANESLKLLRGQVKVKADYSLQPHPESSFVDRTNRIYTGLDSVLKDQPEPRKVPDTLQLDTYKVKVENYLIREQIDLFHKGCNEYKEQTRLFRKYQSLIDRSVPGIDSIYWDILDYKKGLQLKQDSIQYQLDELETNYKKYGPEGFSAVYAEEFPFAFDHSEEVNIEETGLDNMAFAVEETHPGNDIPEDEPLVYDVVDELAKFPGESGNLDKYLLNHIVLPEAVLHGEISGKCYVKFIVSENGQIRNVEIQKGVAYCPECDEEVKRVIEQMPVWIPAKRNGVSVSSWFNLPVKFKAP